MAITELEIVEAAEPLWEEVKLARSFTEATSEFECGRECFQKKKLFLREFSDIFHKQLSLPASMDAVTMRSEETALQRSSDMIKDQICFHYYRYSVKQASSEFEDVFPKYHKLIRDGFPDDLDMSQKLTAKGAKARYDNCLKYYTHVEALELKDAEEASSAFDTLREKIKALRDNIDTMSSVNASVAIWLQSRQDKQHERQITRFQVMIALIALCITGIVGLASFSLSVYKTVYPATLEVSISNLPP